MLASVRPLDREEVALQDALGRTLATDVISSDDIPPFDNSAMDGYAVRAGDVLARGTELEWIGEIPAGSGATLEVRPGTCASIMTGAPIPRGADAVIPIEVAAKQNNSVRFDDVPSVGDNVRRAGEDLRAGDTVIEAGISVTPAAIGVMASLGYEHVDVTRRAIVGVVTTGSELVDVGSDLGPGQIRDSNGPALAALVRSVGGSLLGPWRSRDDRGEIRSVLERALEADVVVVSGGVSVGEYDLVRDELDALGMKLLFWKVRQRPGKPLAFGLIGDTPVFGLPGNPVSSTVSFEQYVRPALAAMSGRKSVVRPLAAGILTAPIRKKKGLHYFARGKARWSDGRLLIEPAGHQGSHVASSLLRANGFIHLPETLDEAPEGLEVAFEWFDW